MSLIKLLETYIEQNELQSLDGIHQTQIPGVLIYRSPYGSDRQPLVYQSGILILAQGYKNIYLDQQSVTYGANDYLVVGVPLPLECESFVEEGKPLLGISIRIPPGVLQKVVQKIEASGYSRKPGTCELGCGLRSVSMGKDIQDASIRLTASLCHDLEAKVLGESLLEELIFRVLMSKEGHVLFDLAHQEGHYARVAGILNRVHQDYSQNLTINDLAKDANMSISAFHQAFRHVTMESPLQYIKKVRLNKAKELIQLEGRKVNEAARMVGYTSPSQFHREYKRLFKETPGDRKQSAY
ncbi:AraC family transcriptional regulator [Vibrio salinus]|uniref:AraC family transcriptional regulator n=1 Tax=Vibrio salinus TaxID=2899784 RepID=UPI001E5AB0EF|nr:AraC family transcriptional regulator N-terminal domain-containing protein [Vibrio salinus]MCE0494179.1 AraC family transcriptional regulator N-terminal domain-containing protein [Vibrio salinus]